MKEGIVILGAGPTGLGAAFQVPTVQSGHSDMTWFMTRWIQANSDAASFLSGQFDPWGMHVNTDYEGLAYPTDAFTAQDSYPVIQHRYSPVFPLQAAASFQAEISASRAQSASRSWRAAASHANRK